MCSSDLGRKTSYDKAQAVELFLRKYPYTLEVKAAPPDRDSLEYFLFEGKQGYCDYFATAMVVLQAKLLERKRQEEQAKIDALKGDTAGSWGNQMRSYVLHPYQMVKDLRTEQETGNTGAVLDGEIDEFVEAGIRWRKQSAA